MLDHVHRETAFASLVQRRSEGECEDRPAEQERGGPNRRGCAPRETRPAHDVNEERESEGPGKKWIKRPAQARSAAAMCERGLRNERERQRWQDLHAQHRGITSEATNGRMIASA